MKKLLVLISIVSLLAFAGSAFAADYSYDAIGHIVDDWTGTESDLVGHVDGTYGSGAYAKYLAEKAANAAKNPSTAALSAISALGTDYVAVSSSDIEAQATSVINAASSYLTADATVTRKLVVVPPKIIARAAHNGKKVVVVVSEEFATTGLTTGTVKTRKGTTFGSDASSHAGVMYAAKSGSGFATPAAVTTNFNGLTSGGLLLFWFDCDTSKSDNVSTAAAGGEAGPFAVITETSDGGKLGSSGGGCALGTSALALAVLGLFIAKRRG